MVVVCSGSSGQLYSRSHCGPQREYYASSMGLRCRVVDWNCCFAICEYPRAQHLRMDSDQILFQSIILYARYGNGIATNNLSKMIAGLSLPGRPIGNLYFAAWSHNVISNAVNLSNDLKMGEYRKRFLFLISSISS